MAPGRRRIGEGRPRRSAASVAGRLALELLASPLVVVTAKPISVFMWWVSHRANRMVFHERRALLAAIRRARREGRPHLFASNHVSMIDDPVVPMALTRMGQRSLVELLALAALLLLWLTGRLGAFAPGPTAWLGWAALLAPFALGALGARKTWWSLPDRVNFSGTRGLRRSMGARRLPWVTRALLAVGHPLAVAFMHTPVVKSVLIDRGGDDAAKEARRRALERTLEIVARGEPAWFFFEGGRSRDPDVIRPARPGVGRVVHRLRARGHTPVVFALHQRGLERVVPIGTRGIRRGHTVDVRWARVELGEAADPQELADAVRDAVLALQARWRAERGDEGRERERRGPRTPEPSRQGADG